MSIQTTLHIPTLHPLCLNLTNSMWYEMLQSTFPGRRPKTARSGSSLEANLIFTVEALMDFNRIRRGLSSVERQYEDRKILRNIAFIGNSTQIKHKTNKNTILSITRFKSHHFLFTKWAVISPSIVTVIHVIFQLTQAISYFRAKFWITLVLPSHRVLAINCSVHC